ncbi:hypothetical protein KIN20_030612 [Parelaphostrongylus tenuis]|uniref:Tetraspanin n=1 Tax=Parelaphostrongylus tenuis TaxID=148309 RepID=A0AAD5R4A7_PARTN|nr:hypothetical protein KIN20_030612 [Parelaphostrongylus tenuis]
MSQGALAAFFVVLVVVFCLELAAAYMAYNKQETIQQYIESSMYDTIRNRYTTDTNYKSAFDTIQQELECCGVKSYMDWLATNWDRKNVHVDDIHIKKEHGIGAIGGRRVNGYGRTPFSCCNDHGKEIYPTNCGVSFTHAPLETYAEFLHSKGCAEALHDSVYRNLDIVIAICVIMGALQLLGMVLAMMLCCCISTDKGKYDY